MYRKIKQANEAMIDRLHELNNVSNNGILKKMIGDLLTSQIEYYQSLLTSVSGTVLRKLHLVRGDNELLMKMLKEHDSVHSH